MSVNGRRRTYGSAGGRLLDGCAGPPRRAIHPRDALRRSTLPVPGARGPASPANARAPYADAEPLSPFSPGPNVAERDVSDKPAYIRALGSRDRRSEQRWNAQAVALKAVDDLVVRTVRALHDRGNLRNTLLVFMSDNGLAVGEHRWSYKLTPRNRSGSPWLSATTPSRGARPPTLWRSTSISCRRSPR